MATISQINGNEVAGKEFYDYVRTEGAVLFSFNPDFSPAAFYGGSWEKITDRFIIGAGGSYSLGTTGGEASVTLTEEQMPPHNHETKCYNDETTPPSGSEWVPAAHRNTVENVVGVETLNRGGGQAHNNIPPYIAANIWRRVA